MWGFLDDQWPYLSRFQGTAITMLSPAVLYHCIYTAIASRSIKTCEGQDITMLRVELDFFMKRKTGIYTSLQTDIIVTIRYYSRNCCEGVTSVFPSVCMFYYVFM